MPTGPPPTITTGTDFIGYRTVRMSRSVDLDVGLADHLRPLVGFGPHVRRQLVGRKLDLVLPVTDAPVAMLGADGAFLALYEQQGELAVPIAVLV